MTWQLGLAANLIIATAYFLISAFVFRGLWRSGQLRTNRLGVATGLIFFSCGGGHLIHAEHLLGPLGEVDAARSAMDWHMVAWDAMTGMVAITYLSLRKSYGQLLQRKPDIFENQARLRLERELREANEQLAREKAELERSNAELEQFAYVASHDMGEPLRMITSYLQLLEADYKDRLDDDAHVYIDYAVDGAQRMRQLIDDLLRYSRAGRAELHCQELTLSEALAATTRLLGASIEERGATVRLAGDDVRLVADPTLLAQLLQNLLSNALKFCPADRVPEVVVAGRRDEEHVELCVTDNGIGIPEAQRERVFKMFQRLHHREDYAGTGIGLAVCQRIAERHGGAIRVEDAPAGQGCRFVVTLPVAVPAAARPLVAA